jgi:hypothetical protein
MVRRSGDQGCTVGQMRRDPRAHTGPEPEHEAASRPCDRAEGTRGLGLVPSEFVSSATAASGGDHEVSGIGATERAGTSRSITIICP